MVICVSNTDFLLSENQPDAEAVYINMYIYHHAITKGTNLITWLLVIKIL